MCCDAGSSDSVVPDVSIRLAWLGVCTGKFGGTRLRQVIFLALFYNGVNVDQVVIS